MVLRAKTLIFWEFTERSDFKGGSSQKTIIEGALPKKGGAWTVYQFKGRPWQERGGGGYPNAHYGVFYSEFLEPFHELFYKKPVDSCFLKLYVMYHFIFLF